MGEWHRPWRWAAIAWALLVLAVAAHQVQFWRQARLDSDVLALLPAGEGRPELAEATRRLSDASVQQVVVLIGAGDRARAGDAADAFARALPSASSPLRPEADSAADAEAALAFYAPYRDRLLTPTQRARLRDASPDALAEAALGRLFGPLGAAHLGEWRSDPLALWPSWWAARLGPAQPAEGRLWLQADGHDWAVLRYVTTTPAFRLDGEPALQNALAQGRAAALSAVPEARVLTAGVPLHAEAAAVQANREVNTIGLGSLLAVLALVWLAFRSLRPIGLVALSLLVGVACALSATALVFDRVHLLTLVFGASLVGVAEDYGIHWFASRQGKPPEARWPLLRHLLPGLVLALVTSALAYLALGIAPFPGLRQMALFSAVGLLAAFLTVVCWFPWLDRGPLPVTRFSHWFGSTLALWPRWRTGAVPLLVASVSVLVAAGGMARLRSDDDLRTLQNSPPELVAAQREVGRLLQLPSPAQFFLVEGDNAEQLLQREEALTAALDAQVAEGKLSGYRAVSQWLPSRAQQEADAALTRGTESAVLARVSAALGETLVRPEFAAAALSPDAWLDAPASAPLRPLWLGERDGRWRSLVMLTGLDGRAALARLEALPATLAGVAWIDRTATISRLLGYYRTTMTALLAAGYLAVALALWWRFRAHAWRALLPTALASLGALAALGWLGEPLQLFNVLALLLLLGVGVDYGIFLVEHRDDGAAWLAVALGAASTLLAFGLLALSATPALHAFGLTMLFGLALVWLLSPCFRPPLSIPSPGEGTSIDAH